MRTLNLKSTHKPIRAYYSALQEAHQQSFVHEGNVAPLFANLLRSCAGQFGWQLVEQYHISRRGRNPLRADGVLLDSFMLIHGVWEAKDSQDDLTQEAKKKFAEGYPKENILFQAPDRVILYQNGVLVADEDISKPEKLIEILKLFFEFQPPAYEQWETAVREFKERVPQIAQNLLTLLRAERKQSSSFLKAFHAFQELCQESINPQITAEAIEEMLIQHLLTERLFRKVFNNPDFIHRNVIAKEIEKIIEALTSRSFSREQFLKQLDRFYGAIEITATTIDDFSQKQSFLNTVYEQFFQGFSVKIADTHGIVYTPQPIVDFMVRAVNDILKQEFHKPGGLADKGVHILDPFVGTGNFILRILRQIPKSKLLYKYEEELHCNEVMLLPYYIACLNIEHEFLELTKQYKPFQGICLIDTFELAEGKQKSFAFVQENVQRVVKQMQQEIFVILGNPPYNAGQTSENENNKNRKYKDLDAHIKETYAKASQASDKTDLADPYVKAFRWASNRIKDKGIVAFITNNSFLDAIAFDGMRKYLLQDFSAIYIIDLGGNVRKNPKLSGTTHNVFGIQIGVCITFLIKKEPKQPEQKGTVFYASVDEFWRKEEKYEFLANRDFYQNIDWVLIEPDSKHRWLTAGIKQDFEQFVQLTSKQVKQFKITQETAIFKSYSLGANTNRDMWVFNYDKNSLSENIQQFIAIYNVEVIRWQNQPHLKKTELDNFVLADEKKIKWSSRLKEHLLRGTKANFSPDNIFESYYRPFCKQFLYFDPILTHRRGQLPHYYPDPSSKNMMICIPSRGMRTAYWCLCVNLIPNLTLTSLDGNQCLPFYIYDSQNNQQENITDWALNHYQTIYEDEKITKWDIFHYIYALLHHPTYRENYSANLRLELPHIPFVNYFWEFAAAGKQLAELHVNYEQQPEYPLQFLENPDLPLDWRVAKMRLTKDKTSLVYNDFLTLAGIPPEVFNYKLGNRSALEWVVDQYQLTSDHRSGIINDPNRPDDPQYVVRLIGQVITVSLETLNIMEQLPPLEIIQNAER